MSIGLQPAQQSVNLGRSDEPWSQTVDEGKVCEIHDSRCMGAEKVQIPQALPRIIHLDHQRPECHCSLVRVKHLGHLIDQ